MLSWLGQGLPLSDINLPAPRPGPDAPIVSEQSQPNGASNACELNGDRCGGKRSVPCGDREGWWDRKRS